MNIYVMIILVFAYFCGFLFVASESAVTLTSSKPDNEKNYGLGNTYRLTCSGGTSPYVWYFDGSKDIPTTGEYISVKITDTERTFKCASNGEASELLTIRGRMLKNYGIRITDTRPLQGTETMISFFFSGSNDAPNEPATVRWFDPQGAPITGASSNIQRTFSSCKDDGVFTAQVSLGGQVETDTISITSLAVSGKPAAPTLTSSAVTSDIADASNVTLTCTHPDTCISTYEWLKDDAVMVGEAGPTVVMTTMDTSPTVVMTTMDASPTVVMTTMDAGHAGRYSCKAVNHDAHATRSDGSNEVVLDLPETTTLNPTQPMTTQPRTTKPMPNKQITTNPMPNEPLTTEPMRNKPMDLLCAEQVVGCTNTFYMTKQENANWSAFRSCVVAVQPGGCEEQRRMMGVITENIRRSEQGQDATVSDTAGHAAHTATGLVIVTSTIAFAWSLM